MSDLNKDALEAHVEKTAKCGKCGGGVRAMCGEIARPSSILYDADILVTLYCRDPKCEWRASQWRPWSRSKPEEL